jgi:hypothetical protein
MAKAIQELRYRTDAPILQCKKALAECDGDMDKAIDWLRAKGAADSVKKEGRETAYGTLAACIPIAGTALTPMARPAAIVEFGAETDFAVRNEKFAAFCTHAANDFREVIGDATHAGRSDGELLEIFQKRNEDAKKTLIAALGENVILKKVWSMPQPEAGLPPRYAPEGVNQPTGVTLGRYVHNSATDSPLVGNIIGLASVWAYGAAGPQGDADDFAQHLVSHLGDTGDVAQQSFLGSDQTVSQWCKQRTARLRSGFLYKYGMESPQIVVPKAVQQGPPSTGSHQKHP